MAITITTTDPTVISSGTMDPGRQAIPFSVIFAASGGTAPYTWSLASGFLPSGLTLNASTGTISGTPLQYGYWDITLKVTDHVGATKQAALRLMIKLPYAMLDPFQNIFYRIYNEDGTVVTDANGKLITNDPNPSADRQTFGSIIVGWSVGPDDFTVTDIRQRGGGLSPAFQDIPQADNYWDLGYWDGRPYPVGGALAVYLPVSLLTRMTRTEIAGKLQQLLATGTLPLIRFYNETTGEESL